VGEAVFADRANNYRDAWLGHVHMPANCLIEYAAGFSLNLHSRESIKAGSCMRRSMARLSRIFFQP
jgi:hypothetical protein